MKILNTFYLALNNQKIVYIKNDSQLLELVDEISNIDEISIDTEFTWRNTYFPRLSLIQIGSAEILYIIDPLVIEKLDNLNSIFEDNEITKVFHSSRGDMAVLKNSIGSSFKNIYDTQIAQKLISNEIDQISYKNLVEFYFYKNLSKSQTNSDWEKDLYQKNKFYMLQKISNIC